MTPSRAIAMATFPSITRYVFYVTIENIKLPTRRVLDLPQLASTMARE